MRSADRITAGWSSANTGNYSWGENYAVDAWGNLQITPMSGKAHGGNFTHSGTVLNQAAGLGYDAAGNLTNYTYPGQYVYDQENRLLSTAGITYTYDGNGERVLKSNTSTGAAVKRYWSMGSNTLAEGDGAGNLTAEYIYFGGKRIARIDLPANTVHYYLSDHLGSTSIVVSSAGTVEEESDYYPFGTEVIVTGPGANELKFTGKRRDTESQLDYFGARSYSNACGRFLTPDWSARATAVAYADLADPQSLNLYSYVRNRPIFMADIDGHEECGQGNICGDKVGSTSQITATASDKEVRVTNVQTVTATTTNADGSVTVTKGTVTTTLTYSDVVGSEKSTQSVTDKTSATVDPQTAKTTWTYYSDHTSDISSSQAMAAFADPGTKGTLAALSAFTNTTVAINSALSQRISGLMNDRSIINGQKRQAWLDTIQPLVEGLKGLAEGFK
jgi:RHS repeat-associated protein